MLLAGVVPVATVAPAGGCRVPAHPRGGGGRPCLGLWRVWRVQRAGFLLVPDREAFLFYALFFGYYPVLYAPLGRIQSRVLRYGAKLLVFNAAAVLEVLLSVYVLGIPL